MVEVRTALERVRGLIAESELARRLARESHLELLSVLRERSLRHYSPHDRQYWHLRQALSRSLEERAPKAVQ